MSASAMFELIARRRRARTMTPTRRFSWIRGAALCSVPPNNEMKRTSHGPNGGSPLISVLGPP